MQKSQLRINAETVLKQAGLRSRTGDVWIDRGKRASRIKFGYLRAKPATIKQMKEAFAELYPNVRTDVLIVESKGRFAFDCTVGGIAFKVYK